MNLATFLMSAALAMATAPNAFAVPVYYDNQADFVAAAGSGLQSESFETVGPVQPATIPFILFPDSNNSEFAFLPVGQAPATKRK